MPQSKTTLYECIGGPRDGDVVRVLRRARVVTLNGERYRLRAWRQPHGELALWERKYLVWEPCPVPR
ncbi:MAG: hypothetical protein ACREON_14330 [Gemmatimonadaceae bacterium]